MQLEDSVLSSFMTSLQNHSFWLETVLKLKRYTTRAHESTNKAKDELIFSIGLQIHLCINMVFIRGYYFFPSTWPIQKCKKIKKA